MNGRDRASALRARRKLKNRTDTPRWPDEDESNADQETSSDMNRLPANGETQTSTIVSSYENIDNYQNCHDGAATTTYRPPTKSIDLDYDDGDNQSNHLESSVELDNDNDGDDDDGSEKRETKVKRLKNSMLCNNQRTISSQARMISRRRRLIHQRRCRIGNSDNDHDGDIDNDDSDNDEDETDSIDDNNNISVDTDEDMIADATNVPVDCISGTSNFGNSQDKPISSLRSRMVHHHSKQQLSQSSTKGELNFTASLSADFSDARRHQESRRGSTSRQSGRDRQLQDGLSRDLRLVSLFRKGLSIFYSEEPPVPQKNQGDKISDIELDDRDKQQGTMPCPNRYEQLQGYNCHDKRRKSSLKQKFTEAQYLKSKGYSKLGNYAYRLTDKNESIFQVFKRFLLLLLIICISCLLLWKLYENLTEEYNYLGLVDSPSLHPEFKRFAVSTDAKPCAKVGSELLAKGGSAVDAAIGTLLCMSIAIPNSMGLGGGCFMTIYDAKKKESVAIDGREMAPDYAKEGMFANDTLAASRGPLSVGIPGELAAYWKAHQMYGKLPWADLFNKSIEMAENGIPMVAHLSIALRTHSHAQYITPTMAKFFLNATTGQYLDQGELLVQKQYAETLKRIRDNGIKEFYGGQTGQLFIKDLKDQGGQITMENMLKYEARVKKTITLNLTDDLVLHTQPIPASGPVLSIILRVMKELGYHNTRPQMSLDDAALYYHRLMETFKFAYGQRAALEDKPDDEGRLSNLLAKLESDAFIKDVVSKIDNTTHGLEYYGALQYFQQDHGTAHVSVLDAEGNAAAVTTSVNLYFGSGLISPSTGIIYNDIMDDFVSTNMANKFGLAPSNYNRIKPGRRPLSSMAPSVFTDSNGNVRLVIGASGGSMITTSIATVSLRNCYLGEDIKTAIDGPRIHHQFLPNHIWNEANFPKDVMQLLSEKYGHEIKQIKGRSSVVMAIAAKYNQEMLNGTTSKIITANSDYRKGGSVDGL